MQSVPLAPQWVSAPAKSAMVAAAIACRLKIDTKASLKADLPDDRAVRKIGAEKEEVELRPGQKLRSLEERQSVREARADAIERRGRENADEATLDKEVTAGRTG